MSYEVFAPFYDAAMGNRTPEATYVRRLIDKHHPAPKTVLELACGTGAVLEQLQPDFEVTGVDLSQPMLELATPKLPGARLIQGDMTKIRLRERFDVVLCVYDSINHLLAFAQWEAVFDRAREHLDEKGVFIFDMNTESKLLNFGQQPPFSQWFGDGHLLHVDVRPPEKGVSVWDLRVFERIEGSSYRLHSEEIPEVAFPADRVKTSLSERFSRIRVHDARGARPTAGAERLYFVCGI